MIRTHVFSYYLTEDVNDKESAVNLDVYDMIKETDTNKVYEIPTAELRRFLDDLCWDDAKNRMITPRSVIDSKDDADTDLKRHKKRIAECDLSFPILVMGDETTLSVVQVCDGMHRLALATTKNSETVKVRFLSLEQHDRCVEKFKQQNSSIK